MELLLYNEPLILQYKWGFGAWTYHLIIPNTQELKGQWGRWKVSGTIDGYEVNNINLAPRKDSDRIISINQTIRQAIGKGANNTVMVTLYLHD